MELSPSPLNSSKNSWKLLPLHVSINWPSLVTLWGLVQKIYSKIHSVSCTNIHHDVKDLVNHGIAKNTKTCISWERNINFLQNKKILNLRLKEHILGSYRFVAEVTFKENLPETEVTFSTPTLRLDNGKAALTVRNLCAHLVDLNMDMLDNRSITSKHLGHKGLYLNKHYL